MASERKTPIAYLEHVRAQYPRACPDDHRCRGCDAENEAECFEIDDIHQDVRYICRSCGHTHVVEGPDA